jgi:hypothetical protein
MYVSIIQTMIWPLVPTSGAGMSYSGPMLAPSAWVNRRVMRSSSACECWPGRQRLHLVEGDLLVVADAPLVGAENVAVLDAVALEHLVLSVIHTDRKVHDELVLGLRQNFAHRRGDPGHARRLVELRERDLVRVGFLFLAFLL